jgi:SOS-response transcriptional repressor LexA
MDGDRVIMEQQKSTENGEIACALINGEATLKRSFKKDSVTTLKRKKVRLDCGLGRRV